MDRLVRIFKGKGKAPEVIEVKRKSLDLLSRVHLVKDPGNPSNYAYHLHPLMPALYRLVPEGLCTKLKHAAELVEICTTVPADSWTETVLCDTAQDFMVEMNDTRISVRVINSSIRIWADWAMEVSETEGDEVKDYPASGKADEAAASTPSPDEDYDPPPPYSATVSQPGPSNLSDFTIAGMPSSSAKATDMPRSAAPPAFEPADSFSGHPSVKAREFSDLSDEKYSDFPTREMAFAWEQVSSRARLKLLHPKSRAIYAEYIQETNPKKIADGIRGQLLFRRTFGHEWQMVVLLTLGKLVQIGEEKVWDEA